MDFMSVGFVFVVIGLVSNRLVLGLVGTKPVIDLGL